MTATIPPELTSAIPDRYELHTILGRGGMATVYLAYDRKHQRDVALKVLRPEVAASLGVERFLKEIQIVARLVHPHILTLHDSGEAEGFVYYVMPYIEGGSLRQRLEDPHLVTDVDRALRVAESVADALSYAHRVGVLHRDIKPENILFAQDHPIVADFGIARAVSASSGARLTRTGISMGTPGYMSPEQAAGFTDVDERTDVYSLAVVVYEMIVGEIPARWLTEDSVRTGRFQDATPRHRACLSAAGAVIEAGLARGLAVRPEQRTPTPAALMDDLRGLSKAGRRRYGPEEIDEIVKRASELEASNPTSTGAMTIGGVESIAREVGISPTLVRSAASSLSRPAAGADSTSKALAAPTALHRFIGGPTRLRFERIVDGELADTEYLPIVEEIRRTMRNVGQVSQLGRSFSWTMMSEASGRQVEIAVSVRGGRTHVFIQENLGSLAGGIWGGVGGGMGAGLAPILGTLIGALHAPEFIPIVLPAWAALTYGTTRTTYRLVVGRRQRKLGELADRLAAMARELIGTPPLISPPPMKGGPVRSR